MTSFHMHPIPLIGPASRPPPPSTPPSLKPQIPIPQVTLNAHHPPTSISPSQTHTNTTPHHTRQHHTTHTHSHTPTPTPTHSHFYPHTHAHTSTHTHTTPLTLIGMCRALGMFAHAPRPGVSRFLPIHPVPTICLFFVGGPPIAGCQAPPPHSYAPVGASNRLQLEPLLGASARLYQGQREVPLGLRGAARGTSQNISKSARAETRTTRKMGPSPGPNARQSNE